MKRLLPSHVESVVAKRSPQSCSTRIIAAGFSTTTRNGTNSGQRRNTDYLGRCRMNQVLRIIRFRRFARPCSGASRSGCAALCRDKRLPLPCPAKNSRSGSGVRAASVPLCGTRDAAFRAALKAVPQPARSAAFCHRTPKSRPPARAGQASPPVTRTTGRDACPTDSARPAKPTNALIN